MPSVNVLRRPRRHAGSVLRCLKSGVLTGIVLLSFRASAGEMILHTVSVHFKPNNAQNNNNPGIGYLSDIPCLGSGRFDTRLIAGVYHNTHNNTSAYAGCYVKLYQYRMVELGAMVGLVTGYSRTVMPSGLLIGAYHINDTWSLKLSIAPVTRGVAHLAVGYRL